MRADGEQNKQKLLDAAEELFSKRGLKVNVAEIVAAAGVAPPTLYRHFGDKDGLIHAVRDRASSAAMARLGEALTQPTGWGGLALAIRDSTELARSNRAIRESSGVAISPSLERLLLSGWEELVQRGHDEGSIRDDFTAIDVPFLFSAAAAVAATVNYDEAMLDRYLALLMEGIRPSSTPLPGRPPTRTDLRRAFA